ncbi:MAG: putative transcriptional regulatory protein for hcr operon [Nocardia sp.]|uniref:MarR family winged helix-turn-helix transcriptional regulator n=1 Tax=Nocardia sp. TaxID=1821 RepID=UPI002623B17A|nr:MarR family winged helix-turn-helix transcriptional regulator [Nocardia sp.]MCU1646547.1 putative transcriptional regulatory protein for hcr operon [Nocardia sp.]
MTEADPRPVLLADSIPFVLSQLGTQATFRFTDLLTPLGIKPQQFGMLRILEAAGGRSQQQLSEALGIHRNVMVGLVDDLEKRGFVERRKHPTDRRAHAVYLLPAGYEMLTRAAGIAAALDAEITSALDAGERETLLALLQKTAAGSGLLPGIHPGFTTDRAAGSGCDTGH